MKWTFLIHGVSGTGKSTRVYYLREMLRSAQQPHPFIYNGMCLGEYFPFVDLIILGKEINRKGTKTWQGIDAIFRKLKTAEHAFRLFAEWGVDHNLVVESAFLLTTSRATPLKLQALTPGEVGWASLVYLYNSEEEYASRIRARSGSLKNSEAPNFKHNNLLQFQGSRVQKELEMIGPTHRPHEVLTKMYDSPVESLAEYVFEKLGLSLFNVSKPFFYKPIFQKGRPLF